MLAQKAGSLQGLIFQNCTPHGLEEVAVAWDACMEELFSACPQLLWLRGGFVGACPIGARAWEALPPSLHALEVDIFYRGRERIMPADQLGSIRAASQQLPKLKWLMVDRDEDAMSRIPLMV